MVAYHKISYNNNNQIYFKFELYTLRCMYQSEIQIYNGHTVLHKTQ